jgi:hypothetical protein
MKKVVNFYGGSLLLYINTFSYIMRCCWHGVLKKLVFAVVIVAGAYGNF